MIVNSNPEPDSLDLLWHGTRPPTRGPKPSLNLERIAGEAIAIADAEGIDTVSLKRVAERLDVTQMALYRYVTGKDQLLAVMVDLAWGDPPNLDRLSGGWRERVREFAGQLSRTWGRHPWLPWVSVGDRAIGPKEMAWAESAVSALAGTGLHGHERMDAAMLIFGHIRSTQSISKAGTQPWSTGRQPRPELRELLREHATRYPELVAAMDAPDVGAADATGREFGLERILDGLEVLIVSRARRS